MKNNETYTVGELAKLAGITVRTLQYYDRCGLLTCEHSEGGRRIYNRSDLIRLQQILFFKSYGFSLCEIRDRLIDIRSGAELARLLEGQRDAIASQVAGLNKTTKNLEAMISEVRDCDEISADKFVAIVELAKFSDPYAFMLRYLSENQLNGLNNLLNSAENVKLQQKRSRQLFSELLRLYNSGADPLGEDGQRLAGDFWQTTVDFSGGDAEMMKSFISMGVDSNNWPDDMKELGSAVGDFMSIAMYTYLKSHGVTIDSFEDEYAP